MAGLLSIGWQVPAARRRAEEIVRDYGVDPKALADFGLISHALAGEGDHPAHLAAAAGKHALAAAQLEPSQLGLVIFAGMTRDYPPPWVGAMAVLHELGAGQAVGFDVANRCAGIHDALWIAAQLVDSGQYEHALVCCGDRFDSLLGPPRRPAQISDAAYSAGGAAAVVSRAATNRIAAYAHLTNPDLSIHGELCPRAGGTRMPAHAPGAEPQLHTWQNQMKLAQAAALKRYLRDADHHNIPAVCAKAGFEAIDFLCCSPLDIKGQLQSLAELGIDASKTFFTLPHLGHMGPADSLVGLGRAIQLGRRVGPRLVMSTRTATFSNALAIRFDEGAPPIRVGGEGADDAVGQ